MRAREASITPQRAAELTGIPAEDIVALAREYATTRPAVIRLNYGTQRSERGGMAVRTIALLPALTGSWKDVGGGLQLSTSQAFQFNRPALELPELQQRRARARGAHREYVAAGAGAQRCQRSAGEGDGRLQFEPGGDRAESDRGAARASRARTCSPSCSSSSRPIPRITPTSCCPSRRSWSTPTCTSPTGTTTCNWRGPPCRRPARRKSNVEIFRAAGRAHGLRRSLLPRYRRRHDPRAARFGASLPARHHAGRAGSRTFRAAALPANGGPFQPFAEGGFGTPSGKCEFHAETLDYTPPVESRLGDRGAARALSAGVDLAQERRQHELDFRQPARDGPADLPWSTCMRATPRRAGSPTATRCASSTIAAPACCGPRWMTPSPPGVVSAPSVRWAKNAPDRHNVNFLTSDRLTDLGGGPTFYNCLVRDGEERRLMRNRLLLAALAACLALAGCRSKQKVKVQATEEEAPSLASTVHVADPRVASQLISGFYGIEGDSWRWTAGKFAVLLRPPRTAAKNGAMLQLKFAAAGADHRRTQDGFGQRHASTAPRCLPRPTRSPESSPTRATCRPMLLGGEAVKVEFALDKALPPSASDQRELGLVVSAVGFEPK